MPRRRLLILAVLATATMPAPAALADTKEVARYTGIGCQEVIAEVPVSDPTFLRSEVPEGWTISSSFFFQGPSVLLWVNQCDELGVRGLTESGSVDEPGTSVAWFATPARTMKSTDLLYTLRIDSSHSAFAEALRRSGHPGGLLAGIETAHVRTPAGTLLSGTATAPGGPDAYTITVGGPVPSDGEFFGPQVYPHGHEGPAGLAQHLVAWTDIEWGIGTAVVRAEPGSYLARILGTTTATGPGYLRRHRFDGLIKAENPLP